MRWRDTLRQHWPEYLIEAWALGTFMLSAAAVATLLGYPQSPVHRLVLDDGLRRWIGGAAMGLTAIALIYSPWGQRSGAHMNPAVTLSYWLLGRVRGADAFCYVLAQFLGALAGVLLASALLGMSFTAQPVNYAATLPGAAGVGPAFAAELLISSIMMASVLQVSSRSAWAPRTGLVAGCLVMLFIAFEEPWSGMSMNPARSFGSAAPAAQWQHLWIYCSAPVVGMLGAATWFRIGSTPPRGGCAKLMHGRRQRCIHCGYAGTP